MIEAHLGDVIGEPLVPLRITSRRRTAGPRWIERGVQLVIGWIAFAVYGALILFHVVALFVIWPPFRG